MPKETTQYTQLPAEENPAAVTQGGKINERPSTPALWAQHPNATQLGRPFILVHMLASILMCLQVLIAYLTLRRFGSEITATLGAFLMVLFYGLSTQMDYLHYAGELLPTVLLMVGFHVFLTWLDESAVCHPGRQLSLLFLGGLTMGAAPWCKLQALPIAGALGLMVVAAIFRARTSCFSVSRRAMEVVAFGCGGVLTTCVMLAVLAECGAMKDFWYSYILGNLSYAEKLHWTRAVANFLLLLNTPLHQLLLVAAIGILLLAYGSQGNITSLLFKAHRWAFSGIMVYAGGALFAVCRPRYSEPHHAIFLLPPLTYAAAILLSQGISGLAATWQAQHRFKAGILVSWLCAAVALYVAYGVQYACMVNAISELPRAQSDSNEKIVALVRDIQKTYPVRSLAIWGWAPGVYVLAGIPPTTRDPNVFFVLRKGPLQKYYRLRFVGDLRANPPDLFVDAVARDAFMWPDWTENDGYESDPEVRSFVEENYFLVDELTLVKGAKPVRFFERRQ